MTFLNRSSGLRGLAAGLAALSYAGLLAASPVLDPGLPEYRPVSGVTGNLSSIGSDSLNNLMTLWAEEFKRLYPSVNIQIQGAGSSTAPPALTEGTASFGPMSRLMKEQEIQAFEQKRGYRPTPIGVAIDALALFVNQDNPLRSLNMAQVDAVFSPTLRCGADVPALRWGDLGLGGDWQQRTVQLFGRNSVSGTYGYFKEKALCKGDFRDRVNEQPGSASVVQSVSASLTALGYSGIGYRTAGVHTLALSRKPGQPPVEATAANAIDGSYPLSRTLYVYVNKPPNRPLPTMELEFLRLVLSRLGQEIVIKDGYVPLPAERAAKELAKLR
jgi:phosphate transport system substrate-binding protein